VIGCSSHVLRVA